MLLLRHCNKRMLYWLNGSAGLAVGCFEYPLPGPSRLWIASKRPKTAPPTPGRFKTIGEAANSLPKSRILTNSRFSQPRTYFVERVPIARECCPPCRAAPARGKRSMTTSHHTVMTTGLEGIPFATTTRVLTPSSRSDGGSNSVDTFTPSVATPIELWLWVCA